MTVQVPFDNRDSRTDQEQIEDIAQALAKMWRRLVVTYAVSGKNVHDAKLVAAMNVHGVKSILTFNAKDFVRYSEITVVSPAEVAGGRG